ncbi:MAG: agmatinase [Rhodothermales bacterium]|jgi:agmatinase
MSEPSFLGLPSSPLSDARVVVLPVPLEATVSYGHGTAGGPSAILAASHQVETFDQETLVEFEDGSPIHSAEPFHRADAEPLSTYLDRLSSHACELRKHGALVLGLGGEHLLTYGLARGAVDDLSQLTVVQIDAHADLRDRLHGDHWSHGTVMRRLWEQGANLLQIGIRSLCSSEHALIQREDRIRCFYAHQLSDCGSLLAEIAAISGPIYLSIDVDGLDLGLVSSTGTPDPGGLTWRQALRIIDAAAPRLVGADIVEYIPAAFTPLDAVPARLAARLLAAYCG